ncbi:hypothetical protein ACN47E_002189 [Coniothyrium glycines]
MWAIKQYKDIGKRSDLREGIRSVPRSIHANSSAANERDTARTQDDGCDVEQSAEVQLQGTGNDTYHKDVNVEIGPDSDILEPTHWSLATRARTFILICMLVFVQTWASASDSLANSKASKQYHVSPVAQDLSTAVYLFGIGSGCIFVGPLSQVFGRNPVYLGFSIPFLLFTLGTAMSRNFGSQIVCRYFAGLSSSAALSINGASVRDMFDPVERSLWFPIMAWFNIVPPTLAPIVGGWVASKEHLDWIWTDWITLIISAFAILAAFLFLPETHPPSLLKYKAKHMRRITGNKKHRTEQEQGSGITRTLKKVLPLSIRFAVWEPAVVSLGGLMVLLYIIVFTFLSGFDYIFRRRYNLTSSEVGACFSAIAIGATCMTCILSGVHAWRRRRSSSASLSPKEPETRLWPAMITVPILPIALFWLGWTNYASISIYSGLAACFCFGIVLNAMYVSSYEYIIDSYGDDAAIALASITMMRYMIAGGMVMAARPMYKEIGVHWTMTLLGCIALLLTPAPYVLFMYGSVLRRKSPYALAEDDDNKSV